MGACVQHQFNSTLGEITFSSMTCPGEVDVKLQVSGQPDWNWLRFQDGEWAIFKKLTQAEVLSSFSGEQTAPGQYTVDLSTVPEEQKQEVSPEILNEIIAEFKKSEPYKHARKEIRKIAREAESKIEQMQRQIEGLLLDIEFYKKYTKLSDSGL